MTLVAAPEAPLVEQNGFTQQPEGDKGIEKRTWRNAAIAVVGAVAIVGVVAYGGSRLSPAEHHTPTDVVSEYQSPENLPRTVLPFPTQPQSPALPVPSSKAA